MMSIFDKFQQLAATRQELEKTCDTFFNVVMQEIISGTEKLNFPFFPSTRHRGPSKVTFTPSGIGTGSGESDSRHGGDS